MDSTCRPLKILLIGDKFVGKTSLIFAYTQQRFIDDYEPTVVQNYTATVVLNKRRRELNLFDTTGQNGDRLSRLRILCYPQTDVILLCFSLIDPLSLDSCRRHWIPEIRRHCPSTPIILVGTKEDLSEHSPLDKRVDHKYATRQAAEMGLPFFTCSSLTLRGLKRVFDEALIIAAHPSDVPPKVPPFWFCCSLS